MKQQIQVKAMSCCQAHKRRHIYGGNTISGAIISYHLGARRAKEQGTW